METQTQQNQNTNTIGLQNLYANNYFFRSVDTIVKGEIDNYYRVNNINPKAKVKAIQDKKARMICIAAVIHFILMCLHFFHITWLITFGMVVNVIVWTIVICNINVHKYIEKQIKARPDEKMTYVISSIVADQQVSSARIIVPIVAVICAIVLPLLFFIKPHMFFERSEEYGYDLRFYTTGVFNPSTIEIPEEHHGDPVTGIRGEVFQNVTSVKEIVIPDSVTKINGNCFHNARNLKNIELSDGLTYLGGSAFKNCVSLEEIVLPDSLEELGGETFLGCTSLEAVILPSDITEIRGNTFEECSSLTEIDIPEGVTRIGGHAFYGCRRLSSVTFPSTIREIGSSAFRQCSSLHEVTLPEGVSVNERAFKESPTAIAYE